MEINKSAEAYISKMASANSEFAIAYAILRLADATDSVAFWTKYLGGGDNASQMGAVEFLAVKVGEIADAISSNNT